MQTEHVIWDWNGTLLNDLAVSIRCINTVLARRKLPLLDADTYRSVFGFPIIDYYKRLGFDFERETFEKVGAEFMAEYEQARLGCKLHQGAIQVLKQFSKHGLTQSVLSARHHDKLQLELAHFQIASYFHASSGIDNHYATSKLDNGKKLLASLQLPPNKVLMIGDSLHDAEVAKALGIRFVLFSLGHQSVQQLRAAQGPIVDSLSEFSRFVLPTN